VCSANPLKIKELFPVTVKQLPHGKAAGVATGWLARAAGMIYCQSPAHAFTSGFGHHITLIVALSVTGTPASPHTRLLNNPAQPRLERQARSCSQLSASHNRSARPQTSTRH